MIKLRFKKQIILFLMLFCSVSCCARTAHRYVIKKPGEASPIQSNRNSPNLNEHHLEIVDEKVLAQEEFSRIKMLELEGRQPYQENRKTTITRTY